MATLLEVAFARHERGVYRPDQLKHDFGKVVFSQGLDRVRVVDAPGAPSGSALSVRYPRGAVGPASGGAQWRIVLPETTHDELWLRYHVLFGEGFDFVKGGKLPGLVGGGANTGGERPNGRDGFSARMMWRERGRACQYLYHPDQVGVWGDDLDYDLGGLRRFEPGRWQRVDHRIVLNTEGERDGIVQGWFDGELALERSNVRFRDVSTLRVDQFYFSTFFGGNEPDWAPTKHETVCFDGFLVSTERTLGR